MKIESIATLGVDIQNDFCPGGALAVPEGDQVATPMNRLIASTIQGGGKVFLSRDWHPVDSQHFQNWPPHCISGTKGAEFHPLLDTKGATIISKGMRVDEDAYSAFEGESESGSSLAQLLDAVRVLVVGGLATDYCVKATVLDASKLSHLQILVALDAIRAVNINANDGKRALYEMELAGAYLSSSKRIIRHLQK